MRGKRVIIDIDALREYLETYARGKENAVIGMGLRELFGGSGACMRKAINELRVQGNPIGSNRDGYYWAVRKDELKETIGHLKGRVLGIQQAIHGLDVALGMMVLDGSAD